MTAYKMVIITVKFIGKNTFKDNATVSVARAYLTT